jgi:Chemoreceptor zinc-binding domain
MGFLSTLFDNTEVDHIVNTAFVVTQRIPRIPASDISVPNGARILAEIDIDAAIASHLEWKDRLVAYLLGTSQERLSADEICQDNKCELGQWLYGAGQQTLGAHVSYPMLMMRHKQFHAEAAKVITLHQAGEFERASAALERDYARASHLVICLLKNLRNNLRYINL